MMIAQQLDTTVAAIPPTQTIIDIANLKKSYTLGEVQTDVLKGIEMVVNEVQQWLIGVSA